MCIALYDQGVLEYDAEEVAKLSSGGDSYAYTFIRSKIKSIELTPAQLALDPCTGSCVIVDVNTGEVRALVTYPGYDNNRLSGTVDADYYNQLREDLSLPLRNNATMVLKAPGFTFKPITAVAALEEGVIQMGETIECTGEYKEIDTPIKCWIYPGRHGKLDIIGGIGNSCNYVVAELAHRMSMDENGNYSTSLGRKHWQNMLLCSDWIIIPVWKLIRHLRKFRIQTRSVLLWDRAAMLLPILSWQDM